MSLYDKLHAKLTDGKITRNDCFMMANKYIKKFEPYFWSKEHKPLFKLFKEACLGFSQLYADKTGAAGQHHNFIGGLLVHTYEMLDILYDTFVMHPDKCKQFNTTTKPDNDKFDFAICAVAVLFHDWGKLKEYKHSAGPDANGRFQTAYPMMSKGHIFMSAEHFDDMARQFGVSEWFTDKVTHCILAHHSKLEWGSPVKPITPEARIVCACDLISAGKAKGKNDYFYAFVRGEDPIGDQNEYYDTVVKPRMDDEKRKEAIVRKINKFDKWNDYEQELGELDAADKKAKAKAYRERKKNESCESDLKSFINEQLNGF